MRYRSKPSEVEAVQWTGDNWGEVYNFGASVRMDAGTLYLLAGKDGSQGWVPVPLGHWVVRQPDDRSDHWPVEDDYFSSKYEPVEEP